MPIAPKQYPVRFTPRGLVDALDATDKFMGACIQMSDLIFDHSNPEILVSRPGVQKQIDFAAGGFLNPAFVSIHVTIDEITYGMIATTLNGGHDQPFAYNNDTATFYTIGGITVNNTPFSPSTAGEWTPPTMDVVGTTLILTHPGFVGTANKIGWMDISAPSVSLTWNAGDLATNPLPSVPTVVANFANRAYFACGQKLPYSDVLVPLTRTNASQQLTVGDNSVITAMAGLPIQTTSSGVIQALIVFKAFQIWQVTGDAALSNLSLNYVSLTMGTSFARAVCQSNYGIYFISQGGPYILDNLGAVRLVTYSMQDQQPDIRAPFESAVQPTRAAGGYANSVYRVCFETIIRGADQTNDYWFDERRRRWTGPHSFVYDCVSVYEDFMLLSSSTQPGLIFKSQIDSDPNSLYTDNTVVFTPTLQSSTFPKDGGMTQKQVVESTIELANSAAPTTYTIYALDESDTEIDVTTIPVLNLGALWGAFVWGDGTKWSTTTNRPRVYNVPWSKPINFQKMSLKILASAAAGLSIGTFYARYQDSGYVNVPNPAQNPPGLPGVLTEVSVPILME